MLEGPEVEAHRHHTGHSRLDIIFGALAVVLSCVSVFIAIEHGRTMERLVAANTWPNISYGTSNESADGKGDVISFELTNTGVGPARIETIELFYKDKPMANWSALLVAAVGHGTYNYDSSRLLGEVMPARDEIHGMILHKDMNRPGVWDTLNVERRKVRMRVCYCSVFDECWVMDTAARRPERVRECAPSQGVEFDE